MNNKQNNLYGRQGNPQKMISKAKINAYKVFQNL